MLARPRFARHVYGELEHFVAGQAWSPFMDKELEYWDPTKCSVLLVRPVERLYVLVGRYVANHLNYNLYSPLQSAGSKQR